MSVDLTNLKLILYAVRNHEGKFFRAKGQSGYGETWVDDINKAKIYPRIGPARSVVTYFANSGAKLPVPELLELTVTGVKVLDESKRVKKAQEKKIKDIANQAKWEAERKIADANRQLQEAQATIKRLTGKK
jgi:hypothetical protein